VGIPTAVNEWLINTGEKLIDKNLIERVNSILVLGTLWAALAICVLGALAYDISYWFDGQ
jgi:hypothetical protein